MKTRHRFTWLASVLAKTITAGLILNFLPALAATPDSAPPPWHPSHGEFIVPSGPGASLDTAARSLMHLLQQRGFTDRMVVSNRPGGSLAIALNELDLHQGDGNYLMSFVSSLLNYQITGALDRNYSDYTPVVTLFDEVVAVVVRADSPYQNISELIEALKIKPEIANIAVATAIGNHIHVGIAAPLRKAGVDITKLTVIPYKSSAESMTALIGGHVNIVAASTPNLIAPLQAGKIRVLAVGAPQRLKAPLDTIPTWIEAGIDIVPVSSQGVLGPKDMPPAQVAFWSHAFKTVTATPEWHALMERNQWIPRYMGPEETLRYRDQEFAQIQAVLSNLGLAKK